MQSIGKTENKNIKVKHIQMNIEDLGFNFFAKVAKDSTPKTEKKFVKTKFCRNAAKFGSCSKLDCTFAHSIEEFYPYCAFGSRCKFENSLDKKCTFLHPSTKLEDYCNDMGIPVYWKSRYNYSEDPSWHINLVNEWYSRQEKQIDNKHWSNWIKSEEQSQDSAFLGQGLLESEEP